jgi:aminobenzoyl-glutamate utilization protein B
MALPADLLNRVEDRAADYIALSDAIWARPELRWAERVAVDLQTTLAEREGLRVTREVGGIPTAFIAEAGHGSPVIAIPGEFDALAGLSQEAGRTERRPVEAGGNGHGCGHNLLGAAALLACAAVAGHLAEHNLPGTIRYYGCPAEEAAAGKTYLVKAGAFNDVDAAVSWHPEARTGVMRRRTLAYCQAYFRFTGVASHAGISPHLGRSALDAVELMNVGTNFLREHMPSDARVHYAIVDAGGSSPNVVQAQAAAYYLVRSPTTAQMRTLYDRVVRIAQGATLMTDTTLEVEYDGGCAEVLPNDALEAAMVANLAALGPVPFDDEDRAAAARFARTLEYGTPEAPLHDALEPYDSAAERVQVGYSTDIGDVTWVVPTASANIACDAIGTPGHSWQRVAQGRLPAAHKGMVHAAKLLAGTAVDLFADPALLAAARTEFTERIARTPYDCPIPEGVLPPPLRMPS